MSQKIGFVGLGKMGKNMVLHLLDGGIDVVAYNRTREAAEAFVREQPHWGAHLTPAFPIKEFVTKLSPPRIVWIMVSAGEPVDAVIRELLQEGLRSGDTIIDGGNSNYHDSVRRARELKSKSIQFIDCGTSGGLDGARNGACLMLGGDEPAVKNLAWLWTSLAIRDGWAYMGPSGAGHFVKMIHNGIEYGIDEAIAEGFEILAKSPYKLDLKKIADTYAHGSIIRGYLIDTLAAVLGKDATLSGFTGRVGGGETGTWALAVARELGVEAKVLEKAVQARVVSRANPTFASKVVSALRAAYGGHKEAH